MTKRIHLYALALLAAIVSLTGCTDGASSDDSIISPKRHEVTLTFDLGIDSQIRTRAAGNRELVSSDDWQKVSSVRVYMFRSDTETGTYTYYRPTVNASKIDYIYVPDFSGKTQVWGDDEAEWEEHEMVISAMTLDEGWYRLVGIARDDIDGDDNTGSIWTFNSLAEGVTTINALTAAVTSGGLASGELFVGEAEHAPVQINASKRLHETIIMKRCVAGVLMYVENIPASISSTTVKSIGIVRRKHTGGIDLNLDASPCFLPTGSISTLVPDGNTLVGVTPAPTDYVARYAIPGSAETSNGYYVNITETGSTTHPNAIFRGAFVTPQEAPTADCTLNLVACDVDGKVLKQWNVKLVESNGAPVTPTLLYPLVANNIYCIGKRNIAEDIDDPVDLGELPDDVIIVHGSWQVDVDIDM